MKKLYFLSIAILFSLIGVGQTTLGPGDIVFLMYNKGANDVIAWMPMVDLQPGTDIKFTNRGYLQEGRYNNSFSNQRVIRYDVFSTIPAGTIFHFGNSSSVTDENHMRELFNIVDNEQVSAFTGLSQTNPNILFLIDDHPDGSYGAVSGQSDSFTCDRPTALVDGQTAFSYNIDDNYVYNGDFTATDAATWRSRIANESNWGRAPGASSSYTTYQSAITSTTLGAALPFTDAHISSSATGNWSSTATWTGDVVPSSDNDVTITTGTVTVDQDFACDDLTINSGASLVIPADKSLLVMGTITNNAGNSGIVIGSTSTGTGKIVTSTTGVSATVRQYITGGPRTGGNYWHYMSLPISGTPNVETIFNDIFVMKHTEADVASGNNGWTFLSAGETLEVGAGYGVWAETNTTIEYTGTLNASDVTVNLTYAGSGDNRGYNLVGNPFPTTLNWENVALSGANDAIYLYDPNGGSGNTGAYASYISGVGTNNQTKYIPPMQAFFVRANAPSQTVTFEHDMKVIDNVDFKSAPLESIIRLEVECNNLSDETVLRANSNSSKEFDGAYDAYKLFAKGSITPQIYSELEGVKYSINSISQLGKNVVMPISILTNQNAVHTLSLKGLEALDFENIYIRNLSNNQIADLMLGDYTFMGAENTTVNFELTFSNVPNNGTLQASSFNLYTKDGTIYVDNLKSQSLVKVVNVNGQVVKEITSSRSRTQIPISRSGVYIVQLLELGNLYTRKVVVK